jgi:hypothetical protein
METAMNDLSFEAKALIARAREADGPGPERRARVKRALAAALVGTSASLGTVGTVAAATAAGKSALTAGSVAMWLGIGAALGTVASAPALVVRLTRSEPSAHVAAPSAPAPRIVEAPAAPARPAPANAPAPIVEAPSAPVLPRAEAPASASSVPSAAPPSLADETRVLEAAQRELASGRPASALSLLDEHAKRFPAGALGEERTAARVLSLCALGRSEEARRMATAFLEGSPRSPLIPRLRGSCALDGRADDKIPAR